MKTLLLVVAVFLVICEGYIPEYRKSKSKRNRYVEEDSYEEDYGDLSLEETEEEQAPRIERKMRASVSEPSYGYSKSYRRRDERDYVGKMRKPNYLDKKSRSKYQVYEKSPHRTLKKDIVARQHSTAAVVRGRKKDHRSAPVYESMRPYPSPPAPYSSPPPAAPYHKHAPVKTQCSHQLLISCTPTVTKVPCKAHAGAHHPTQAAHVPESAYHEQPAYHTPPPVYTPPVYKPPVYTPPTYSPPVHNPPVHSPPVHPPPAAQYLPQPKPLYHHHSVQPQPEPVHQPQYHNPGQHPYYQQPKPTPHFPAPPAYHQPYQPTYKSMEPTPSFAAPVSEDNLEPSHHPVISAFPTPTTTTTTTQHTPIAPIDRDQNLQEAESNADGPANTDEEVKVQAEAPAEESVAETTTSSPLTTTTTTSTTPLPV
ncbi:AAEL011300-PA [Aedes aegypti]|uniref:AAEL011300-PA n=1 Tax=Aedes aegypti TaxID=7159 RepID=Q16QG0_AEDAE|nr:AAEL011300-PA [Aedes aegypti]